MIGRVYQLGWGYWRVLVRWRDAPGSRGVSAPGATFICRLCGLINPPAGSDLRCAVCGGERQRRGGAPRNVLLEQLVPVLAGPPDGLVDGELGPLRVVDGLCFRATGHVTVRPFRGLRRVA